MPRRSVLRFSGFEYRYQEEYGTMPDYDFDKLVKSTGSVDQAAHIRQERLDTVWKKMKYEHEHKDEIEQTRIMEQLVKECPF